MAKNSLAYRPVNKAFFFKKLGNSFFTSKYITPNYFMQAFFMLFYIF